MKYVKLFIFFCSPIVWAQGHLSLTSSESQVNQPKVVTGQQPKREPKKREVREYSSKAKAKQKRGGKPISKKPKIKEKLAEEKSGNFPSIVVKWYRPETEKSELVNTQFANLVFSGKSEPGATVSIINGVVIFVSDDKNTGDLFKKKNETHETNVYKVSDLSKDKFPIVADKNGYFAFSLQLPPKTMQFSVKIEPRHQRAAAKVYLINSRGAEIFNMGALAKSPFLRKRYRLWLGTGFNALLFRQHLPGIGDELRFDTFKGPSFFGKGAMWLTEDWDLSFTAKVSPGETASSEGITITTGDYNWSIFSLEGTKYPEEWKYKLLKKYDTEVGYRFGVQFHSIPFIVRPGPSTNMAEVKNNEVMMLTAGGHAVLYDGADWTYELFMRYQYPLSSGRLFAISPEFSFDGSLGMMYRWRKNTKVGVFWYGQWHKYNVTHHDPVSNIDQNGSQELFFSNIDLRVGWEF